MLHHITKGYIVNVSEREGVNWTRQPNSPGLSNTNELHPEVMDSTDDPQTFAVSFTVNLRRRFHLVSCAESVEGSYYFILWSMVRSMLNGIQGTATLREVTHPGPDHASKINLRPRLRIKYVIVGFFYSLDLHSHIDC